MTKIIFEDAPNLPDQYCKDVTRLGADVLCLIEGEKQSVIITVCLNIGIAAILEMDGKKEDFLIAMDKIFDDIEKARKKHKKPDKEG